MSALARLQPTAAALAARSTAALGSARRLSPQLAAPLNSRRRPAATGLALPRHCLEGTADVARWPTWGAGRCRAFAQQAAGGEAEAKAKAEEAKGEDGKAEESKAEAVPEDVKAADASGDAAAAGEEKKPELSEVEQLAAELSDVQEKVKTKKHELLLALADFENSKKKYLRERQVRQRNAIVNFARKMVETYDEFEASELAKRAAEGEEHTEACLALREGVHLTRDLYKAGLERFDVASFAPEPGEHFKESRHEDVAAAGGDVHKGTVAEVIKPGWELSAAGGGAAGAPLAAAVLRRARVRVAALGEAASA